MTFAPASLRRRPRTQTGNLQRVKLLFDENLSPRLPELLSDAYPGSAHVHNCGLGSADDLVIWQYAKDNAFAIVSKDSDFQERSVLLGFPPKIIWLRVTNGTAPDPSIDLGAQRMGSGKGRLTRNVNLGKQAVPQ